MVLSKRKENCCIWIKQFIFIQRRPRSLLLGSQTFNLAIWWLL